MYSCMPAGSETLIQLAVGDSTFLAKRLGIKHYRTNEEVFLTVDPDLINVFAEETGRLVKLAGAEDD